MTPAGHRHIASHPALALVLAAAAGCFSPKVQRCAVQCNTAGDCPPDTVCMADDFCHASESEQLCRFDGDGGLLPEIDAGPDPADAALIDAGPPRPPAVAGEVIVSEIMNDPCAGEPKPCLNVEAEWFELHNTTGDPIELENVRFVGDNSDENFTIDRSLIIPPRGHIVLAVDDDRDVNGDIAVDFVYDLDVLLLNDGPDQIELVVDLETPVTLDIVIWADADGFPNVQGSSISLDPDLYTDSQNDAAASWCAGSTSFGVGDLGSPGQRNPDCP